LESKLILEEVLCSNKTLNWNNYDNNNYSIL